MFEGGGCTIGFGLGAEPGEAVNFQRISNFAEGVDAAGRSTDEQELVAEAQDVHLLATGEWSMAEDLDDFAG